MPWNEVSIVDQREEFVRLASQPDENIRLLCRRFQVSPTTAYKWMCRYRAVGREGLMDLSRRPRESPSRASGLIEQAVLELRHQRPAWGARKLRRRLRDLGVEGLPAASTVHAILRRHDLINPQESTKHRPWQRFEHDVPNRLWQMDFKGHFATHAARCHPLTVLDDHSRFALGLLACPDQKTHTVQHRLSDIFRRYGLPERMTMDNGSPWGSDAALRPLAQRLQPPTPSRSSRHGSPGQPLSTFLTVLPRVLTLHPLRLHRSGSKGPAGRRNLVPWAHLQDR